jgi:hypothetical protein
MKTERDLKGSGFRSLITQEERGSFGVPPEFKGVVQADGQGKLHFPNKATVEITNQSEKAEDKLRGEGIAKFLNKEADEAPKAAQRAADLQQLSQIISVTDTGFGTPGRVVLDRAAQFLGLSDGTLASKADGITAIVNRIAPTLREAGSGTVSDADLRGFLASLPSLTSTPGGNELILSTIKRAADLSVARSQIAAEWQRGAIKGSDARARIADIDKQSIYASDDERKLVQKLSGGKALPSVPSPTRPETQPAPQSPARLELEAEARRRGLIQ